MNKFYFFIILIVFFSVFTLSECTTVLATCFTDDTGYHDNNLYSGLFYAELSKDPSKSDYSALGNLPYLHKLKITYKGKSVIAKKGDVGQGGPSHPKIDLHKVLAQALGINDCDNFEEKVEIESA